MTKQHVIFAAALLLCAALTTPAAPAAETITDVLVVRKVSRVSEDGRTHNYVQLTSEALNGITIIAVKINHGDCFLDSGTGTEFPYKMAFDEKLKIRAMHGPTECNPMNILVETNLGENLFLLAGPARN